MTYFVYLHIRNDKGSVFYVGKGRKRRISETRGRSKHWGYIVAKAGGFTTRVVWSGDSEAEAYEKEKQVIAEHLNAGIDLCNVAEGGGGVKGYKHSPEMKEYLRQKSIGNKSRSGQKASEEERRKISDAQRGKRHSESTKHRMGLAVRCVTTGVVYPTLTAAANDLKVHCQNITHVCKGKFSHTGGYVFEYVNGSGRAYTRKAA